MRYLVKIKRISPPGIQNYVDLHLENYESYAQWVNSTGLVNHLDFIYDTLPDDSIVATNECYFNTKEDADQFYILNAEQLYIQDRDAYEAANGIQRITDWEGYVND